MKRKEKLGTKESVVQQECVGTSLYELNESERINNK